MRPSTLVHSLEGAKCSFSNKYPKYYPNKNFVFRHRYPKSYSNINLYWQRGAKRRGPSIHGYMGVSPERYMGKSPENAYIPFWKLCTLGHSTVICFLVVKSFIVANDDQLRISFIILQTSQFFLQIW